MQLVLALALLAPAASLTPAWHHQYAGQLLDDAENTAKRFTLHCIVTAGGVYWSIDEQGAGQWPWSSRFGKLTGSEQGPAVLFKQADVSGVIELASPQFRSPKPLGPGVSWEAGGRSYTVEKSAKSWRIGSRDSYGIAESLWVDFEQPLMRRLERDVFVGQGERYKLQLEITSSKRLGEDALRLAASQYESLLQLREQLGRPQRVRDNDWSKAQLTVLQQQLPTSPAASLEKVLEEAAADVRSQATKANALAAMSKAALGKAIPFKLASAKPKGPALGSDDLRGKVVVLHFWTYQSKPLEEPYGQIGYLDFLRRKLPQDQAAVLGVVAHNPQRAADEAGRDARKLGDFMNLSFPLMLDDGAALAGFGDPRKAGSGLPLFVVLNRAGEVVHYHAGLYEVDAREGLKELRQAVEQAMAAK